MSGVNIPSDSSHLSDIAHQDMVEQFGGIVDVQFAKASIMRQFVPVKSIRGTDTGMIRRMGTTDLQALTAGVRPASTPTAFGKVFVTVDTVVAARDNRSMLNELQIDFDARAELATDQGKQLGKFYDEAFLIQGIKSAALPAPAGLNNAIGAGKLTTLTSGSAHLDPDLLYTAISGIITQMQEEDIDTDECAIFVRPTQSDVLMNNTKLISRDFSKDNGDFANGTIKTVRGVPIVKTARIPQAAISGHFLSNAGNSFAYDLTATEAKAVAIIMHPKSLFAGETMPLESKIFWSDVEKQWFIDSWYAFGVTNRRPDVCGVVRKQ